jgi:hypothetical protein
VHWRQAERIAESNLRERHLKSIANRQSDIECPHIELAHQVRIPTQSGHRFRIEAGHRSDLMPATIPK